MLMDQVIKEIGRMVIKKEEESFVMLMDQLIKDIGRMINIRAIIVTFFYINHT
jgi:hypothetical protein